MRKPHVVYWQNIPSPHMVARFNALTGRGAIAFEAWFNAEREPDRSWDIDVRAWAFRARFIPERSYLGRQWRAPFALGVLGARAAASRTALRVLPNYDAWSERAWWKEAGKHVLFRAVDGALTPGPDGARLAGRYGLPVARVHRVTQSIDVDHFAAACSVGPTERARRRADLGLCGCVFLYVGRLWSGKGLDYLLDAYRLVRARCRDVSLLIVGDGVDESRYQTIARELPDVAFTGFVQPRDLPRYYALADALVFPTLGDPHGLVVKARATAVRDRNAPG